MKTILLATALLALSAPIASQAASHAHGHGSADPHAGHMMGSEPVAAEVRALNLKTRKLTLKHGELKHLGMPGMTMVFAIDKKVALPADLKVGDKLKVKVEDLGGTLTVTELTR